MGHLYSMAGLARLVSLDAAATLLALAPAVSAQNACVLWRRFSLADNPAANDARLWRARPGTKKQQQWEAAVKEYRTLDPDKLLPDSAGRGYRIEDHGLPQSDDPRPRRGDLMTKPRPEQGPVRRVLPIELQVGDRFVDVGGEWEVISRPYTATDGKSIHVHIRKVSQPATAEIRTWNAPEHVSVKSPAGEEEKR